MSSEPERSPPVTRKSCTKNSRENGNLYHIVVANGTLRVLDSGRARMEMRALSGLAPGHYKVPMLERFAPPTRHHGPGRALIATLSPREIEGLTLDGKCESAFGDRLKFDRLPVLAAAGSVPDHATIHGGGETLSATISVARFQPLTATPGVRLHNSELTKLLEFLWLRLRIQQLIILTVLRGETE